jgi:hypothetical protein
VKKFVRMHNNTNLRICLQIVKPQHKELYYSGVTQACETDQVLCVEELKL